MSRDEKLIERLKTRPPQADFADVQRVLELKGRRLMHRKGSHVGFKKGEGEGTIVVPLVSGRTVKRAYLDQLIERLEL
jgi:predicted RNA binding protein YcfA (HicA-like mRNA interferase family)